MDFFPGRTFAHLDQKKVAMTLDDLIVVTTAELDNRDPIFQLIEQYSVPAVRDSQ